MTRSPGLDPRQRICWENYINPTSPTFADAKNSAIAAGYTASHAVDIKKLSWFRRSERRVRLHDKGETVLEEMLDMPVTIREVDMSGGILREYVVTEPALIRIKQDTAKFVVERLDKENWSTRQEMSGPDGGPIVQRVEKIDSDKLIDEYLNPTNLTEQRPEQS